MIKKILLLSIFLPNFCIGQSQELIQSFNLTQHRIDVVANHTLMEKYFRQPFFVEYEEDINLEQLPISITLIPFILSVITVVWASNMDFYIDELDQDLAYGLQKIKKVLQQKYPSLAWSGNLIPRKLIKNSFEKKENTIAVMFSGGVDTTCTSLRHSDKKQLLITVWGSDANPYDYHMWKGIKKVCMDFAQTFGHDFTYLRSNFTGLFNTHLYQLTPEITSWWKYTCMGISYCGLVAPIMAAKGYSTLYVGSTYTKDYTLASGTLPELDENACFGGISIIHDSYDLNRQEKIALIAETSKNLNKKVYLRPCWKQDPTGKNCQNCFGKCLQTMNALLIEGENPREYGFTLSDKEIIHKTMNKFTSTVKPLLLSCGSRCRWQDMQERIKEKLKQPERSMRYSPEIHTYLHWLSNQNMEKYRTSK